MANASASFSSSKGRTLFERTSGQPFPVSRSKIDLFLECPRCFYLDRRLGIPRPQGFPFTLNNAVDELLKREFDIHRAAKTPHPLMKAYGIAAVPFKDERLEEWRDARRRGVQFFHEPTGLLVRGGIDDVWQSDKGELHVVDYKATSKRGEINLDAPWQDSYKRQVEVYQWLFRQNGFTVSPVAYFVYVNGRADREAFDARLEFDISIIPYEGSDTWIPGTLSEIKACLSSDSIPPKGELCEYCPYREAAGAALLRQEKASRATKKGT